MKLIRTSLLAAMAVFLFACQTEKNPENTSVSQTESLTETGSEYNSTAPVAMENSGSQKVELIEGNGGINTKSQPQAKANSLPVATATTRPRPIALPGLELPRQDFKIQAAEGGPIYAENGTYFRVPPHAFVDKASGKPVSGEVTVSVREAYSRGAILSSGLPTQTRTHNLRSGGVIEITAKVNGRPCEIADNKAIFMEFRNAQATGDMRLWSTERDDDGYVVWKEEASAWKQMMLVPFPLLDLARAGRSEDDLLQDSIRRSAKVYRKSDADRLVERLEKEDAPTTWLSTREFRDRLTLLRKTHFSDDFLDIYLNNTKKDLVHADKVVLKTLYKLRRTNAKKYENENLNHAIEMYEEFVSANLKQPERLPEPGFELNADGAIERMMALGISEADANRYALIYSIQEDLKREWAERLAFEAAMDEKRDSKIKADLAFNTFGRKTEEPRSGFFLKELGWFNNDAPLFTPNPKEVEVNILVSNDKVRDYTRCYFVNDRFWGVNELRYQGEGLFGDTMIEKKRKGKMVAVSYVDGQYYMGQAQYQIGDQPLDLTIHPVTMDAMKGELEKLN